jgi:thiamine-monophosphate kinase
MPSDQHPTIQTAGEFGLLSRLLPILTDGEAGPPAPLVDLGDDAAAWVQPAAVLVASTDALVEGVHFDLDFTGWEDLGWKALAVNLSDLAAMGAAPAWALVTLVLRPTTPIDGVEALYRGLAALARETGCRIVGGDTVSTRHETVVGVTVLGSVPSGLGETLLRRDRGQTGDLLAVTGTLGASAAGLHTLRHPGATPPAVAATLAAAHRRPRPQLAAGTILRQAGVRCAMDVSDGLLADVAKLCAASGVGAIVRAADLPIDPGAREVDPTRALAWAAGGGEDYQLVFAAPAPIMARARLALAGAGLTATEIGELTGPPDAVRLLDPHGQVCSLPSLGWDHFAPTTP